MLCEAIKILDDNSDKFGWPHVIGFLDAYHLSGLREATAKQMDDYIKAQGLTKKEKMK